MASTTAIRRPRIKDLHSHLVCGICMGYFVDATTINECLHTFCRSCIVKYLDTSNFCPMCDVQIHKSRPLQNLRPDKMLQDLVYKVVPGFYATEMQKRRDCYSSTKAKGPVTPSVENVTTAEMKGEPEEPRHYSPDESISLSLEYYIETDDKNEEDVEEEEEEPEDSSDTDEKQKNPTRRYYKCPAAVCIRILKKLLRSKYGLHENEKVDIIFKKECLPEHFTLIDVGYIFSLKKKGLLKFYFRFYTKPQSNNAVSTKSVKRSLTDTTNGELKRPRVNTIESGTTTENSSRKNDRFPTIPITTTTHSTSLSNEEPEKKSVASKAIPPAPRLPSPKRTLEKNDEKTKRPMAPVDSGIPTKKTKQDSPKVVQKPETPPAPTPKPVSQPPKPIQPGLKPPSQTSLLLKQQIAQQREQQKQQQQQQQLLKMQRQMLSQKQVKLGMNRIDNKSPMPSKQIPQLQKLNQKQVVKNNARPVMPQPTTHSIGTQSLPIISKAPEPAPKQTAPPPKTASMGVNTKVTQSHLQAQRTPTSNASVSVSVSTTPSMSKSTPSPSTNLNSNLPPMNSADQRRLNNDMIEKNKLRPVVVIERHGNGRPKVKQVPSPLKLHHLSREFNKIAAEQSPSTPKTTTSATTLAVAPTDSATKVKIIKTPTNSPENNDQTKTAEASKSTSATASSATEVETPKGKGPPAASALDLSGKSTRKSDSPNSSVGSSPSPPAPKVPSPVQTVEQRKTPPAPPPAPVKNFTLPPPVYMSQTQKANNKSKPVNKASDIMKIAQNSLNEKLPFFRQSQQFPSMPNMQVQQHTLPAPTLVGAKNLNSFTYLWNEAMMRQQSMINAPKPKEPQQKSLTPQPRGRPPNSQGPRQVMGPRATMPSKSPNLGPIRIPNPTKNSPPRHMETTMTPTRVHQRIHDLFPNPQQSKPGPNQAVRHIPNPSLLGRQQNVMRMQHMDISPASVRKDEITITPARNPALPSPSSSLRKIETLTQNLQRSICEGKLTAPPSMSIGVVASEASQ